MNLDVMRAGACPAVVAQWQSTGGSSHGCPGFDSWRYSKWIVKRINASRQGFKEGVSESAKQELEKQLKSQAEQTQRKIMMNTGPKIEG